MLTNRLLNIRDFNLNVFEGNESYPQSVCNFFLSLTFLYNNFQDLFYAYDIIDNSYSSISKNKSIKYIERDGMCIHLLKIYFNLFYKFFYLIADYAFEINEPSFKKTEKKISTEGQRIWTALKKITTTKESNDPLVQSLLFIRNQAVLYYKQIDRTSGDIENEFFKAHNNIINQLHRAIYEIITTYIQSRDANWRVVHKRFTMVPKVNPVIPSSGLQQYNEPLQYLYNS